MLGNTKITIILSITIFSNTYLRFKKGIRVGLVWLVYKIEFVAACKKQCEDYCGCKDVFCVL